MNTSSPRRAPATHLIRRFARAAAACTYFALASGISPAQALPVATSSVAAIEQSEAAESSAPQATPDLVLPFTIGGYAEALYSFNFNQPSNGITNFRGFDNRHNSFTLSNVALDALWDGERISGRLTLQIGHTPSTYYLAEPAAPGASGSSGSGAEVWKYVQQAYAGYRFDVAEGLLVTAGLCLSPVGPEGIAVRDNWNWSRSNLFFALPFYHTGARAALTLSDSVAVTLAVYNGWNSVVDNNDAKSVSLQLSFSTSDLAVAVLYFGGIERGEEAPEGSAWRNLFDAHLTWHATDSVSFLVHANAGFEPNDFGTSAWVAGAVYARAKLASELYLALRGDFFDELVADGPNGTASAIFWPVAWVASGTLTVDYRPHERVSIRLEYRHDQAEGDMYFGDDVAGDGATTPFGANRDHQDTLTAGVTTWF
ncbi:MAG: porin [Deltaproteobacteria bacterium]|nr:porin [Deltaproteobacteria bacterium]